MPGRGRGRPPHPGVLTPAEQRVLEDLRRGGTNVEIAVRLGLSPETVKTHIASMLGKLGLDDRHTLASWRPDRDRRRVLGLLALPPVLASLGRPLLWAGTALGGVAVVAAVVVLLVTFLGDEDEHIVLPPTEVGSCDSGVAVPDPAANAALLGDCDTLLAARDRLAGRAVLNWSAGRPMTRWTGVTVAGTPQRVTKLELADSGLTGEIPPALGDLTALTELRLNDNQLSGRIPSKLSQLDQLTHIYLDGNSLTGCLPSAWNDLNSTNGFQAAGLQYCDSPEAVHEHTRKQQLEGGQTVSYQLYGIGSVLTVDLPEGYTFRVEVISGDPVDPETTPSTMIVVVITDTDGYKSGVAFDPDTGEEVFRFIIGEGATFPDGRRGGAPAESTGPPNPLNDVFQRISESAWLQE